MPDTYIRPYRPKQSGSKKQKGKGTQQAKQNSKQNSKQTAKTESSTTPSKTEPSGGFKFAPFSCGTHTEQGLRPYQEDRYVGHASKGFFAVYDGHSGDAASQYLLENLEDNVFAELEKEKSKLGDGETSLSNEAVERALKESFKYTDSQFLMEYVEDGSTCCVVYCSSDEKRGTRTIHCANTGDSRAILVLSDGGFIPLSRDHKPTDADEKKRIESSGHTVDIITELIMGVRMRMARADGILAVSRSFGDPSFKDFALKAEDCAVTCMPEVKHVEVDPKTMRFVVVACDGIWDVYSSEEVAKFVVDQIRLHGKDASKTPAQLKKTLDAVAKTLVDSAIMRGSVDNCTAVIARIA